MREISGQCHCGNINYQFTWPGSGQRIPVRACECTYCQKRGAVWISNPDGTLDVKVTEPQSMHHYQFGHQTATFHICGRCGIVVMASCDIDDATYAVVNVNTFENIEPEAFDRADTDFEGENNTERLTRRKRNWTPTTIRS